MVLALPISPVARPSSLDGIRNGQLPPELLVTFTPPGGGAQIRLIEIASWAFEALFAAAANAGFRLMATSPGDSYRDYDDQAALFRKRHTRVSYKTVLWWDGSYWILNAGAAPSAVPGTSNHGDGIAVDLAEQRDTDITPESLSDAALQWLIANAALYGISAELSVEPWHWRYHNGDRIPPAVIAYYQTKETVMRFTFDADLGTPSELANRVHIGSGTRYRVQGQASKVDALLNAAGAGPIIHVNKASLYPDKPEWDYKRAVRELLGTLDPGEYDGDGDSAPPSDLTAVEQAAYSGAAAGAKAQLAKATTTVTYPN